MSRVEEIRTIVANANGLRPKDLLCGGRSPRIAEAREVAMSLACETTQLSLTGIANAFRVRDHTTVLRAVRRVAERAGRDEAFAKALRTLREQVPRTRWCDRFRDEMNAARATGVFLAALGLQADGGGGGLR